MKHQLVVLATRQLSGKLEVGLHILCIGNVKHLILSQGIPLSAKRSGTDIQKVSSRFQMRLQRHLTRIETIAEPHAHDKQILIIIAQDGIRVRRIVQILFTERFTDPRHEHVVQVYQVEVVTVVTVLGSPLVVPSCRKNAAMELRTVLRVVEQRQFTRGRNPPPHVATQEGEDKPRERESAL